MHTTGSRRTGVAASRAKRARGQRDPNLADSSSPLSSADPRLPHERDESVGATDGRPDKRIRQGHDDLVRGIQDTSRAPEADRTYQRLKKKR